jgi:hypothetical protein
MVLARLTLFDAEGRPARTISMPPTRGAIGEVLGLRGPTIVGVSLPAVHGGTSEGLRRDSIEIYPVGRGGQRGRRVAVVPGRDQLVQVRSTAQGVAVRKSALPFGYGPLHAMSGPFVVTGGTEAYDLVLRTLDGTMRTRVRVDVPGIPVRGELLREWARAEAADGSGDAGSIERRAGALPLHDWAPQLTAIAPERDGGFWVRRFVRPGEETAEWVVHSTEGRPLGRVRVPAAWEIREIGCDYLLALERGRDGEETVIVASLER